LNAWQAQDNASDDADDSNNGNAVWPLAKSDNAQQNGQNKAQFIYGGHDAEGATFDGAEVEKPRNARCEA
jgi:hypothetical protein